MIGIVNTGIGNVMSVRRAIEHVSHETITEYWRDADKLVMPGQGSFASVSDDFKGAIRAHIAAGKPYLGICLGLQILYEGSDEAPDVPGLGVLPGRVRKLEGKTPRMGYEEVPSVGRMYFCHSYSGGADIVRHGNVTGVQFHPEKSGVPGLEFLRRWVNG